MNNSCLFQTVYVVNCSRQGRHIITLQLGTQQKLIAAGYFQPELRFLLVPARTFKFGSGTFPITILTVRRHVIPQSDSMSWKAGSSFICPKSSLFNDSI